MIELTQRFYFRVFFRIELFNCDYLIIKRGLIDAALRAAVDKFHVFDALEIDFEAFVTLEILIGK